MTSGSGRLSKGPHPVLLELLYDPGYESDRVHALPRLLQIDAAHVVMLAEQGILTRLIAGQLLRVNRDLTTQIAAGAAVLPRPSEPHRGLYYRYEQEYIDRLGPEVGGSAHVARSRNDINATLTRLRLRDELASILDHALALAHALCTSARANRETLTCGFTHRQPAQPSTLGHYFAGVCGELVRTARWLEDAYATTNRCPMGAAAGFGTSFAIDPARVSSLLGFDAPIGNSTDAVASRDYAIQAVAGMATAGSMLTRVSTDLQEWAGLAYGFITWDDDLVSTSSIMPQKRNAYVLENVRGRASQVTGALVNVLIGLKSAPWTNSVEVSADAMSSLWAACDHIRTALRLMHTLVTSLVVMPEKMTVFLQTSGTAMTAVADLLVVRYGIAFRLAHDVVARLVNELPPGEPSGADVRARLERLMTAVVGRAVEIDEATVASALDAASCVRAAAYGGGPAPHAVDAQVDVLEAEIATSVRRLAERRRHAVAATELLTGSIETMIGAL
ncbi:argininosuccinate lyase [soil metagenome]